MVSQELLITNPMLPSTKDWKPTGKSLNINLSYQIINLLRCDQCGESFARLDNLLRHSARHKHGKIFDCTTCGKGFHRKVRVEKINNESETNPKLQDKLLEHEKVHSEYTFPCQKCSKTFHTNDALKHHLPLHEVCWIQSCKQSTAEVGTGWLV